MDYNFNDGKAAGWVEYSQDAGRTMLFTDGAYTAPADTSIKTVVGENISDCTIEVDVKVLSGIANSGVIFRVTNPKAENGDFFNGYTVGINDIGGGEDGTVYIGRFDQSWNEIGRSEVIPGLLKDKTAHLKVVVKGSDITVYADSSKEPVVTAKDDKYASGAVGVRSHFASVSFDNFPVKTEAAGETGTSVVSSNPKTGDAGVLGVTVVAGLSGLSSLVLLRKKSR
ncbi:family 16 glycoside hydrolase [Clostridium thermarum]|uniref:family 16 glycoside hydrolase n=1 Tax=Clostridium thermarum TaxID=1716543 RepID=UPI00111F7D78|nr:family 16 glycoside hydrolase [Clostridium thermarum]